MTHILRETAIVPRMEEAYLAIAKQFETGLQEDCAKVAKIMNITFKTDEDVRKITPEWLEKQISDSEENVKKMFSCTGFLPDSVGNFYRQQYATARQELAAPIEHIVAVFAKYPAITITIDRTGRPWFAEKEIKAAATVYATHRFTDEEREYWATMFAVTDALNAVRKFESAHGVNHVELPIFQMKDDNGNYAFTIAKYLELILQGQILVHKVKPVADSEED